MLFFAFHLHGFSRHPVTQPLAPTAAAGVGAGAINTGNVIGQTLQQSGQAQAQAALAGGAAKAGIWGDIAGSIGTVAGLSKGSFGTF